MNSIDKQHSWDRIHTLLKSRRLADEDTTSGEMERVIRQLVTNHETLDKLKNIGDVVEVTPIFTDVQVAQLKSLISIAVWLRSEQLAHPDAVLHARILCAVDSSNASSSSPYAEVDTHNLAIHKARAQFEAGQVLYQLLHTYCQEHAIPETDWSK